MRLFLITLAMLLCFNAHLRAQDFRIDNFHENLTDLSAAISGVKDRNQKEAALLRFAVRDNKFELEANLGIIQQENVTGEIRIYVPEGTKRITIRHPMLGVLRDYTLPEAVKSKTTYDAEIVITNNDYLQALFGGGNFVVPPVQKQEVIEIPVIEQPKEEITLVEEEKEEISHVEEEKEEPQVPPVIEQKEVKKASGLHFSAGLGFNAVSVMGPSLHLGIGYQSLRLEAGFVVGLDQVKDVSFTMKGQSSLSEAYDYSANKFWLRLGYKAGKGKFHCEPQLGASFNMISGKSKGSSTTDYFKSSNPISLFGALRFSYEVAKSLDVHLTPQYDFTLGGDQVFDIIKKADNKIKAWAEGFGVNIGIIYNF